LYDGRCLFVVSIHISSGVFLNNSAEFIRPCHIPINQVIDQHISKKHQSRF
jgi:hypothetical protein